MRPLRRPLQNEEDARRDGAKPSGTNHSTALRRLLPQAVMPSRSLSSILPTNQIADSHCGPYFQPRSNEFIRSLWGCCLCSRLFLSEPLRDMPNHNGEMEAGTDRKRQNGCVD